jgi:protease-4
MKVQRLSWALALLACAYLSVPVFAADTTDGKDKDKKETAQEVIAHFHLKGSLEDLGSSSGGNPLLGAVGGDTLPAAIERIQKAKKDKHVKALYLQIEDLHISWGRVNELRAALKDFRSSGKKVYVYAEDLGMPEYLVACAADEIILPELGGVQVTGIRVEMTFFKELFDKFNVTGDFLTMGDFKAAGEPFTRSKMSEANRKQWEEMVEDYYSQLAETIAQSRHDLTPEKVKKIVDEGPFSAKQAQQHKLIDRITYEADVPDYIKGSLKNDKLKLKKNYGKAKSSEDMSSPLALLKLLSPPKEEKLSKKPKVAVIYANGAIVTGKGGSSFMGGSEVGSTTMVEAIRKADAEPTVKAIVLRVDSGGGSALASDLIWKALKDCKKPVVASMGDVAGSGGYYICCSAKKIYCEPGTITGSIGVIGGKIVYGPALEKFGVTSDTVSRGKNSGVMSANTKFSDDERRVMLKYMQEIYDVFLDRALEGRHLAGKKEMSRDQLKKLAGGRIYTGRQALKLGLVDELGTLEDAITHAKQLAQVSPGEELEIWNLPKTPSFFDKLLDSGAEARLQVLLGKEIGLLKAMPELRHPLHVLEMMARHPREKVWMMLPCDVRLK